MSKSVTSFDELVEEMFKTASKSKEEREQEKQKPCKIWQKQIRNYLMHI